MTEFNAFMQLYLFQFEHLLSQDTSLLKSVKFQSEEANTDEDLKRFIKNFILSTPTLIPNFQLNFSFERSDGYNTQYPCDMFINYRILNVYMPTELTSDMKEFVKSQKSGVYTDPDLLLQVSDGSNSWYVTIELKSTKNNKIPGSSIKQISPYEWVIFIQHHKNSFAITSGVYLNCITSRLQFPDRNPRPEVGFENLKVWNDNNRAQVNNTLFVRSNAEEESQKVSILSNWQRYLVDEWMNTVTINNPTKGEKEFNNVIRLFSLELLLFYNDLPESERTQFTNWLNNNINKN